MRVNVLLEHKENFIDIAGFEPTRAGAADLIKIKGFLRVSVAEPIPIGRLDESCFDRPLGECAYIASDGPLIEEIAYRYEDVTDGFVYSLDLDMLVCPSLPLCVPVVDGLITTIDGYHMTETFSLILQPAVSTMLDARGVFD